MEIRLRLDRAMNVNKTHSLQTGGSEKMRILQKMILQEFCTLTLIYFGFIANSFQLSHSLRGLIKRPYQDRREDLDFYSK